MADQTYIIEFRSDGIAKVNRNVKQLGEQGAVAGKSIKDLGRSLKAAAAGYLAFVGVRGLAGVTDEWTRLNSAVRLVTNSEEELIATRQKLIAASKENRSEVGATAKLYQRLIMANRSLGKSSDEVLQFTDLVQKSLAIGGASAQETASTMLQLSQGLGSVAVRGEEFRAVMEAAPRLMKALQDTTGLTVGELKELTAGGKFLSKDFFEAVVAQAPQLRREFEQVGVTFSQAGQNIKTSFLELVGSFNEVTRASTFISSAMLWLADNMKLVVIAATALAAVGLVNWASSIALSVAGLVTAFTALKGVLLATIPLLAKTAAMAAAFFGVYEAAKTFFEETQKGQLVLLKMAQAIEITAFNLESLKKGLDFMTSPEYYQGLARINEAYNKLSEDIKATDFGDESFGEKLLGNFQEDINKFVDAINIAMDKVDIDVGGPAGDNSPLNPSFWENLTESYNKFAESFGTGMQSAIDSTKDLGSVLSESLTDAIGGASDEFAKFVTTGKADFKSLAMSIVQDLISIIIKQQILNAISGFGGLFGGGGAGAAAGGSIPARQFGGLVQAGQPYTKDERRPEIFVPQSAGRIIPYPQQQQASPSIRIVNAVDGDAVLQQSSESVIDDIVLNSISRNSNQLRGALP